MLAPSISPADIRVLAVRRTRSAISVGPKILLLSDGLEELALPFGKNEVGRAYSCNIRIPFSTYFNLENRLAETLVVNDLDISELKAPCLIRPQPGIAGE